MALTLLEAKKIAENQGMVIRASIIEEYAQNSDILRVIPFETIGGNAISYNREHTLPGVGFRGVNEGFDESTGIINPQTEALVISGGDLDVDSFLINTMGSNIRSSQESMKVKSLSHAWTRTFIKGDSSANPRVFDGLQRRVTGSQLIPAGTTSGGDALSLQSLDEAIDQTSEPTHLIMNKAMRRRLSAASRNQAVGGYITYEADQFGRRTTRYNDLEILVADTDNEDNEILPFDEENPGGGTPASTSIYVVSFMTGKCFGIQGRVNGIEGIDVRDLGELHEKPVFRTRVEWYTSVMIEHGRSVTRLHGIKNAPITA